MTSLRTLGLALCLPLAVAAAACGKKGDDASPTAKNTASADPPVRDGNGKLTKAGVDAAWKSIFITSVSADPIEKKKAAFEAKVGAPAKVEKDAKIWFVVDGASCFKVELGKDGTKGDAKVDASECAH